MQYNKQLMVRYRYVPEFNGASTVLLHIINALPLDQFVIQHIVSYLDYKPMVDNINNTNSLLTWTWIKQRAILTIDMSTGIKDINWKSPYNKCRKQRYIINYIQFHLNPLLAALGAVELTIINSDASYECDVAAKLFYWLKNQFHNIKKLTVDFQIIYLSKDILNVIFSIQDCALYFKCFILDYFSHRYIQEFRQHFKCIDMIIEWCSIVRLKKLC